MPKVVLFVVSRTGSLNQAVVHKRRPDAPVMVAGGKSPHQMAVVIRQVIVEAGVHPLAENFCAETELVDAVALLAIDVVVVNVAADDDARVLEQIPDTETDTENLLVVIGKIPADVQENGAVFVVVQAGQNVHIATLELIREFGSEGKLAKGVHFRHGSGHFSGSGGAGGCGGDALEGEGGSESKGERVSGDFHEGGFVTVQFGFVSFSFSRT
jgi:hypothetical protein